MYDYLVILSGMTTGEDVRWKSLRSCLSAFQQPVAINHTY